MAVPTMTDTPRVYVTRQITEVGLDRLENYCEVFVWERETAPPHDRLVEELHAKEVDGLYCTVADTIDTVVMDASSNLRSIGTMSVGYDHIDIAAADERDIALGYTPGVLSETTADLAWALLMAGARRIQEATHHVRDGQWDTWGPRVLLGRDVCDATLGVVGLGGIGTAFAKRAAGFDMDVLYSHTGRNPEGEAELEAYGIDAEYCELSALLDRVDFLSIHVPLKPQTEGLISEDELRRLNDEAILVNTSRGEVVDTDALNEALTNDWIRHAAIDVIDPEPIPADHPLLEHAPEKLTVTPHIGSASVETREEMTTMTVDNILAGLRGDPVPYSVFSDAGFE